MKWSPRLPSLLRFLRLPLIVAGFFALTFSTYGSSLSNNFVFWNDPSLIYQNVVVKDLSFERMKMAFTRYDPELYIPLTFLSYQLDYKIAGLNPFVYHLDSLIIHTLNALLTTTLILMISGSWWIALFTGLLFAVHPMNVEAVAWASSRKDVLSTFFFLLSLLAYIRYRDKGKRYAYFLSIVAFVLALLSKVNVAIFPFVLLLSDFRKKRAWSWPLFCEKIPFFLFSAVFGIIGWYGKQYTLRLLTLPQKVLLPFKSIVFYLQKLLFPLHLSAIYPYNQPITFYSTDIVVSVLFTLVFAFIIFHLWLRAREITFGILFFIITLFPTLLDTYKGEDISFASDHYVYLPSIGFFFFVCMSAYYLCKKHPPALKICTGALIVALLVFSRMSASQAVVWHDSEKLFGNTLQYYPDALGARLNLITLYMEQHNMDKALQQVGALMLHEPRGRVHHLLGDIYLEENSYFEAESEYKKSIEFDPNNPDHYASLGIAYANRGEYKEAIDELQTAIALNPQYLLAHSTLSSIYLKQSRFKDAEEESRNIVTLQPFFPWGHYLLGITLEKQQRIPEAVKEYQKAMELDPGDVDTITSLAILYLYQGKNVDALDLLKRAYELDPKNQTVQTLARQLVKEGVLKKH